MKKTPKQKISNLIRAYPHVWDHGGMRVVVRENFARVLACRRALGAEVFVSPNGEIRTVMHTCKSRACPSCGYWQTLRWMHEVATRFPDVPCSGIVFSMPDTFWEIFRTNRRLLPALADLGSGVLQDWALERYSAEVPILVVPHTFNAKLKFNVHLHVLAGREGLDRTGNRLVQNIHYYAKEVTRRWRHTLVDFLIHAIDRGQVRSSMPVEQLRDLVQGQRDLWWKPMVRNYYSQKAFLHYIARYLRCPPMADYRILSSPTGTVRFLYKDKKSHEIRVAEHSAEDFLLLLADQCRTATATESVTSAYLRRARRRYAMRHSCVCWDDVRRRRCAACGGQLHFWPPSATTRCGTASVNE
jgi:hypothetical protein